MTKLLQTGTWVLFVVLAFAVGAFAGISDEHERGEATATKLERQQNQTLVSVVTVFQCDKPQALILSKGDGSVIILQPVLDFVAEALYAQVPEGFSRALILPCFTST